MWHGPEHWLQSSEKAQLQERLGITYNFGGEMDALRWAQEMNLYILTDSKNLNNTHTHNPNQLSASFV